MMTGDGSCTADRADKQIRNGEAALSAFGSRAEDFWNHRYQSNDVQAGADLRMNSLILI